jgi:hypothetical protein
MNQVALFCVGAAIFAATVCASVLYGLQSFGRRYELQASAGRLAQLSVGKPDALDPDVPTISESMA